MRFKKHIMKNAVLAILFVTLSTVFSGCGSKNSTSDIYSPIAGSFKEDAIISYLGPEGTYTEEAAKYFFDSAGSFLPMETVDALLDRDDVYVVGEVIIPISQTLMGIPGASIEDIKTVYSHAQGIKQSEQWRKEHIPDAAAYEMDSTAAAAAYVAGQNDKTLAAVAAPGAAKLYGLEVLAENVQITDANKTRFYVLLRELMAGGTNAVFAVTCEANKIDDLIIDIHNAGLELVTIHDRPEGSQLGKYNYIIEVISPSSITDDQIDIIGTIPNIRFFGSFNTVTK